MYNETGGLVNSTVRSKNMTWTDEQIDEYVEDSFNLLESMQDKLEKEYGLGHFERWDLDQEKGRAYFFKFFRPSDCM